MENVTNKPKILRTRFIPFETVDISSDELIFRDEKLLITKWKAIKPRNDISGGTSCAFLDKGYKISRFFNAEGNFAYWYCDIIEVKYENTEDKYELVDLLLDIKVFPNGELRILDADELAEALEKGLISQEQACKSLRILNNLLEMINEGKFPPEECICNDK